MPYDNQRWSLVFVPTIKKTRRRPQTRRTDMSLSAGIPSFIKSLFGNWNTTRVICPVMPTARNISERASSQLESRAKTLKGRRLCQPGITSIGYQLHQPACFLNESGNLLKHSLINICSFRCIKLPHMPFQMHKALAAFGSLGVFRKAFLPPLGSSQML